MVLRWVRQNSACRLLGALLCLGLLAGCDPQPPAEPPAEAGPDAPRAAEDSAARCSDGVDNDGDGRADCADQDCWRFATCQDLGALDLPRPDLPRPDLALPDAGTPDLTSPDLASPDLALADLSPAPDTSPDLPLADLSPPDAAPPDLLVADTGTPCAVHHQCPQKWFCYLGHCIKDPKMPVYHCGKPGCLPGHWCVGANGKKSACAESAAHACADACDCGPAHCCVKGVCVKDSTDPWRPGGAAPGGPRCEAGVDATYCCARPQCHVGRHAYGSGADQLFRCHDRSTKQARAICGGKACRGSACNCDPGEVCVDTTAKAPPGRTCLLLSGGSCVSHSVGQLFFGHKTSELLSCCTKSCLKGTRCEVGWERRGGRYSYTRVVKTCGSCGNGKCDEGEFPGTCPQDCSCGDGVCAPAEVGLTPPCADCQTCGDGKCDPWESPDANCNGSNAKSKCKNYCKADCSSCGDGWCAASEDPASCPQDCGGDRCLDAGLLPMMYRVCGDGVCQTSATCDEVETCRSCPQDCGPCAWAVVRRNAAGEAVNMTSVWGSSPTDIFAVGGTPGAPYSAAVLHSAGKTWDPMFLPGTGVGQSLGSVWGTSPSNVYAVGPGGYRTGSGFALRYDGKRWSRVQAGGLATFTKAHNLKHIWGSSASDIHVTTRVRVYPPKANSYDGTGLLRFDGTQWLLTETRKEMINGLWGSSGTNVVAVGTADNYSTAPGAILRFDGKAWSRVQAGTLPKLEHIWGSSASNIFVAGYEYVANKEVARLLRYDGQAWSNLALAKLQRVTAVWGSSGKEINVIGYDTVAARKTFRHLRFDGTSWTDISLNEVGALTAVWLAAMDDVVAVGPVGKVARYDGKQWRVATSAVDLTLGDAWASGPQETFIIGHEPDHADSFYYSSHVLRYDGAQLKSLYYAYRTQLNGVWGASPTQVYAVGSSRPASGSYQINNTILRYDGQTWSKSTHGQGRLFGVWGSSASHVVVVGGDYKGVALRSQGSSWSWMYAGNIRSLRRVWGSSAKEIFAVGSATIKKKTTNVLFRSSGGSFSTVPLSLLHAKDVWGASATQVFVADREKVLRYDGAKWSASGLGPILRLERLGGHGSAVYGVGYAYLYNETADQGAIGRFDGAKWHHEPVDLRQAASSTYTCPRLNAITVSPQGEVRAYGSQGTVLRRCPAGKCP